MAVELRSHSGSSHFAFICAAVLCLSRLSKSHGPTVHKTRAKKSEFRPPVALAPPLLPLLLDQVIETCSCTCVRAALTGGESREGNSIAAELVLLAALAVTRTSRNAIAMENKSYECRHTNAAQLGDCALAWRALPSAGLSARLFSAKFFGATRRLVGNDNHLVFSCLAQVLKGLESESFLHAESTGTP